MRNLGLGIVAIFIAGMISCSSKPAENSNSSTNETNKSEQAGKAMMLTKDVFLAEIMDYEKNPETWDFKGNQPILIDFYADWCGPCRITSPIIEELASEYAGKIKVYKVNVDKEKELSAVFGIRSIPTFLYIPMEGMPTMASGIAQSPEETKQMFKQNIDKLLLSQN